MVIKAIADLQEEHGLRIKVSAWIKLSSVKCAFCAELIRFSNAILLDGKFYCKRCYDDPGVAK